MKQSLWRMHAFRVRMSWFWLPTKYNSPMLNALFNSLSKPKWAHTVHIPTFTYTYTIHMYKSTKTKAKKQTERKLKEKKIRITNREITWGLFQVHPKPFQAHVQTYKQWIRSKCRYIYICMHIWFVGRKSVIKYLLLHIFFLFFFLPECHLYKRCICLSLFVQFTFGVTTESVRFMLLLAQTNDNNGHDQSVPKI